MIITERQTMVFGLSFGILIAFFFRVGPLLKSSLYTFAYDYGFYLDALSSLKFDLSDIISPVKGGYSNPLFYFSEIFGIPKIFFLDISFLFLTALVGLSLYHLLLPNQKWATIALFLFGLSVAQNEVFFMFLWKTQLGLFLLLVNLKLILSKSWKLLPVASLFLFLSHRTTFIIFLFSFLIYISFELYRKENKTPFLFYLASMALLSVPAVLLLQTEINNFFSIASPFVKDGIFFNIAEYSLLSFPYFLLVAPGLYFYIKVNRDPILPLFFFLSLGWVLVQLPFYNRIIIYLDISVIIISAYFLSVWRTRKLIWVSIVVAVFSALCILSIGNSLYRKPLISESETAEILEFAGKQGTGYVLAIDSFYAPWLLGFSQNFEVGAPGLFTDRHTYDQWRNFWEGNNQIEFLSGYPRPLFIYQRDMSEKAVLFTCLKRESANFYRFVCEQ